MFSFLQIEERFELSHTQIPLGDWTMVRLLIETLKAFGSNVPGVKVDKVGFSRIRIILRDTS